VKSIARPNTRSQSEFKGLAEGDPQAVVRAVVEVNLVAEFESQSHGTQACLLAALGKSAAFTVKTSQRRPDEDRDVSQLGCSAPPIDKILSNQL
jgi:predicted alpha/beta hydrolase